MQKEEQEMNQRRIVALRNHKVLNRDMLVASGVKEAKQKMKQKSLIRQYSLRRKQTRRVKLHM